jgi:citrate lyase subunit alpha / citrate CoA-transferase
LLHLRYFPYIHLLAKAIEAGVVTQVVTAYMSGSVADVVSEGKCLYPCVMQTHGGRALSIESGKLKIDVAFIASPAMDESGNISGRQGKAACGSLGYAIADAHYATMVVAITDTIEPLNHIDIPKECVDVMIQVDSSMAIPGNCFRYDAHYQRSGRIGYCQAHHRTDGCCGLY